MGELELTAQLRAVGVIAPEREFFFAKSIGRRWRFDFAWPQQKWACEVDGGGFVAGRHSRGLGIEKDAEKLNEAVLLGWRVLRVTPRQVRSGEALMWIERALEQRILP